jgi:hypothetical protein
LNKSDLELKEEYTSGKGREILKCGPNEVLLVQVPNLFISLHRRKFSRSISNPCLSATMEK